jgi:hypothetical protein
MELPDLETSPLALASNRVIRWLRAGELSELEAAEGWSFSARLPDVAAAQQQFRTYARPIEAVTSFTQISPRRAHLEIEDPHNRMFNLRVIASGDGTGRVVYFSIAHQIPPNIVVRRAVEADSDALQAIEAATPVTHDGMTIRYLRADPFAQFRLVDADVVCLLAEVDGQPAAQHIDLHGTRRLGGTDHTCVYRMRTRILPEYQGRRLWPALNWTAGDTISDDANEVLVETSFLALGNTKIDDLLGEQASRLWNPEVHKLTFDLRTAPGGPLRGTGSRRGRPSDAASIARRLDQTHGRSELAPVFTERWVRDRLTRSASDYTWNDLVLLGDAAVGVWDPGLELTIDRNGDTEVRRQAFVLDWGSEGSNDDVLGALAVAMEGLKAPGATHLSLFASPALPAYELLADLAAEIDRYRFFCRVPEPPDAAERGVHVDPLWF